MNVDPRALRDLRSRLFFTLALRQILSLSALWAFLWGVVVLVGRGWLRLDAGHLLWGALGLLPLTIAALVTSSRRVPSGAVLQAVIDRRSGAGGLLMAARETDIGAWGSQLPGGGSPRVVWNSRSGVAVFLAGATFLTVAFFLPKGFTERIAHGGGLDISGEVERLEEQITTLKEENIISDPEAETLKTEVHKLKQQSSELDPVRTWEALDHLSEKVHNMAEEAAEQALSEVQTLSEVALDAKDVQAQVAQNKSEDGVSEELTRQLERLMKHLQKAKDQQFQGQEISEELQAVIRRLRRFTPEELGLRELTEDSRLDDQLEQLLSEMSSERGEMSDPMLAHVQDDGEATILHAAHEAEWRTLVAEARHLPAPGGGSLEVNIEWDEDGRDDKGRDKEHVEGDHSAKEGESPEEGHDVSRDVIPRAALKLVKDQKPRAFRAIRSGIRLVLDPTKFGSGERYFEMTEDGDLRAFTLSERRPSLGEIPRIEDDSILSMEPTQMKLFLFDEKLTKTCRSRSGAKSLQSVQGSCRGGKMNILKMLQALNDSRLISAKKLAQCRKAGMAGGGGGLSGRGGVSRGRGDAPITWKSPSNEEGVKFKEVVIEPSSFPALDDSQIIGVSTTSPDAADPDTPRSSGALRGSKPGGGSANTQSILPRHRGTVQRFFERK